MRILGPISAQPPGHLYGQSVQSERLAPERSEAARDIQAHTLPPPVRNDAAQLTLLMAHAFGRAPSVTTRRATEAYRRAASGDPAPTISVTI